MKLYNGPIKCMGQIPDIFHANRLKVVLVIFVVVFHYKVSLMVTNGNLISVIIPTNNSLTLLHMVFLWISTGNVILILIMKTISLPLTFHIKLKIILLLKSNMGLY